MASNEKISTIFTNIRNKVQSTVHIPSTVLKKNEVRISESNNTITITKKK